MREFKLDETVTIKLLSPIDLTIITRGSDDPTETLEEDGEFKAGEKLKIIICDQLTPPREIQFEDGCVAFVTEEFWKAVELLE